MDASKLLECQKYLIQLRGSFQTIAIILIATFFSSVSASAFPAKFGLSPDNSLELLTSTIRSAKRSLLINVYEFDSPEIADAVIDRVRAGVSTEILVEGRLADGPYSPQVKETLTRIRSAMTKSKNSKNHIFVKNQTSRFRFNHAKYVIVDGSQVLVSTENFKESGHPKAGKTGNRGWEVVLHEPRLATQLKETFDHDSDRRYGDVDEPRRFTSFKKPEWDSPTESRKVAAIPIGNGDVTQVRLILAPKALPELLELMRSAETSLDLEFMSLPPLWSKQSNPLVFELIETARRGVRTRVLLSNPFPDDPRNVDTAKELERIGHCEKIPLSGRIVDPQKTGIKIIHNKGLRIDKDGVLISSINGTENSVTNNREVAVYLESQDAGRYFGAAFDFDWSQSPDIRAGRCDTTLFQGMSLLDGFESPFSSGY